MNLKVEKNINPEYMQFLKDGGIDTLEKKLSDLEKYLDNISNHLYNKGIIKNKIEKDF